MRRISSRRIYEVNENDFPIDVEVKARNLADCQAVVSDAILLKNSVGVQMLALQFSPPLSQASLIREFTVVPQSVDHDSHLFAMLLSFATAASPATASYLVTLKAASGDVEVSAARHPISEEDTTVFVRFVHA